MRILLLSNSYRPVIGGLQTVAHSLSKELRHRGHDLRVVTNRHPRNLPNWELFDQVPVHRWFFLTPSGDYLRRGRPDLFLASFYFYPSVLLRLQRLMRTFRPDVINVHFPDSQVPFIMWLRRRFDFQLVVSLHGHEVVRCLGREETARSEKSTGDTNSSQPLFLDLQSILRSADAVTACSRHLLDRAIELEPSVAEKGYAIHNGIDPELYCSRSSYSHPRPYILAFGRFSYEKGFDMLLQAFAQVAVDQPDVDLILAGDGEEQRALLSQAGKIKLNGRVIFYGPATKEEVVRLLNGCLFVVVPSRRETFGIAALEAMASGKATVATRVGGLPEFLDESSNCLVEPSIEGLARGLCEMLRRRDELAVMGKRNRNGAAQRTWSRVVEQYLQTYRCS